MKDIKPIIAEMQTEITDAKKLALDHWYNGLPNVLKACISQWRESTYEQRLDKYLNPSQEFISQEKIFRTAMEKHNFA